MGFVRLDDNARSGRITANEELRRGLKILNLNFGLNFLP
jgi:hypothetical protein